MTKADADAQMDVYRALQADMQKLGNTRQQLISQVNENGMVKQELDLLDDSATVFKLVGPILVKQELGEARVNVEKRLEFIKGELEKVQNNINEKDAEVTKTRDKIVEIQRGMQASAAEAAQAAGEKAIAEQAASS